MLYYFLFAIPVIVLIFLVLISLAGVFASQDDKDSQNTTTHETIDIVGVTWILGLILIVITGAPSVMIWSGYADDLARINAQDAVIEVQQERIDELKQTLQTMNYPTGQNLMQLNADAPVSSVVDSLSDAHDSLARAKSVRAEAIRNVESTRLGPWSGVITFVGDYDREHK